jgi:predicted amidohydrolase YtcJ
MGIYFTGGDIWCSPGKFATSVRLEHGKISELNSSAHDGDRIIDLDGGFLAPAFVDGHAHPLFAGREAQGPLLNALQSVSEMVAEVKRFAEANPNIPWILGGAYEAAVIERGDFLASWLDEVVADRPVVLQAVDHHTVWVNSKALEIAGITSETADPVGGTIARNSDGSPRGTLREPLAMDLVMRHAPLRTIEQDISAIQWASDRYLEAGVTAATDAWIEPGMAEAYIAAEKSGALAIDINLFFLAQPDSWRDRIEYFSTLRSEIEALGDDSHLRAKTIKIIADGALSSGTAALLDPYLDDPSSTGLLIWSDTEILEAAKTFDAMGFQLHIHAIGDAAVRQALDTIEMVITSNPTWDRRPVIAHAQLINPADLPRFNSLGVIANYQPLWTHMDSMNKELIAPRIGHSRNNSQYQLASMVRSGARVSYGSDWPVTSYLPLAALGVPTHRQTPDGQSEPWSPEESITVEQSLTFYTAGVAYQTFNEKRFGVIEVGMTADLVHLSANPLSVDPLQIPNIMVVATYKAGEQQ